MNIRIGILNARSIKSKQEFIMKYLKKYKLDALLITETWIKIQMKMTPGFRQVNFAKMIMKYLTSMDKITLLYSITYNIKTVTYTKCNSFES